MGHKPPSLRSGSAPDALLAGLMGGLRVGQAFGVLLLPGFGVSNSSPPVPGHPASMCDSGIKSPLTALTSFIANIMIGAMTGTLILDKTRRALPRIS